MKPIKHTVQCHCILPQYKNRPDPVFHKFVVFGWMDDSDTLVSKYAECNNCSALHRVYDICKSEIMVGKDSGMAVVTLQDIKIGMPDDVVKVLESYQCDLPVYEHVDFILKQKMFGEEVVIVSESLEEEVIGKKMIFSEFGNISIQPFSEKFSSTI